jgi:S1-C subfamily serine protease
VAINPCTLAVLSSQDVATFERVLAKLDRWFSTSTQNTNNPPFSVTLQATTNGSSGTPVVFYNIKRISLAIIVPSGATAIYLGFAKSFGVVASNVPQYGGLLPGGTFFVFGPEYCGDVYLINTAASGSVTVTCIELLRDDVTPGW